MCGILAWRKWYTQLSMWGIIFLSPKVIAIIARREPIFHRSTPVANERAIAGSKPASSTLRLATISISATGVVSGCTAYTVGLAGTAGGGLGGGGLGGGGG
eukprot:1196399-Prorocentrum_minimum.AAC.14